MQVFIFLSCNRCKWWRKCKGTTEELQDLVEHKPCANCHGPRKFKCPKCANIIKSRRILQDDPPEMKESEEEIIEKVKTNPPVANPTPPLEEPKTTTDLNRDALAKALGKAIARRLLGET